MKCILILLVVNVGMIFAQVPGFGGCPDFDTKHDFDMGKFLGSWYEAERYVNIFEAGTRCVRTNYTKAIDGRFLVANEIMNRFAFVERKLEGLKILSIGGYISLLKIEKVCLKGICCERKNIDINTTNRVYTISTNVKRVLEGEIRLIFKGSEARLNVKYPNLPIPLESQFSVLETDYDNFAVMWSCSSLGLVNTQNAWILTRDKFPAGTVLQRAYAVLDRYKLNRTFFFKTEQNSCEIASAEPNKAESAPPAPAATPTANGDHSVEDDCKSDVSAHSNETTDIPVTNKPTN